MTEDDNNMTRMSDGKNRLFIGYSDQNTKITFSVLLFLLDYFINPFFSKNPKDGDA